MRLLGWTSAAALVAGFAWAATTPAVSAAPIPTRPPPGEQAATLAGGCFWCVESTLQELEGVSAVISGYTGGHVEDPTYKQVCSGTTGHTEAVRVHFDPQVISYERLLDAFWREINPTDKGGQFADRGSQYRPGIFYHDEAQRKTAAASIAALDASGRFSEPVRTELTKVGTFYPAEDYHQDYYKTNPWHYKRYRVGSGRVAYLARTWGDSPGPPQKKKDQVAKAPAPGALFVKPTDAELKARLTPLQYEVTQHEGTERAFQNEYWDNLRPGIYVDVVSGEPLFSSTDKYKSGTGWPSFFQPLEADNIVTKVDTRMFMQRVEIRSKLADSHLGHVFPDGPPPTGKRYCMNSAAMRFVPAEDLEAAGLGRYRHLFEGGGQGEAPYAGRAGSGSSH